MYREDKVFECFNFVHYFIIVIDVAILAYNNWPNQEFFHLY
jgi:hypothetical protein